MCIINSEHETTSPPIHRLPLELLKDIFTWLILIDPIGELEVYSDDNETVIDTDSDTDSIGSDASEDDVQGDAVSDTGSEYSYVSRSDLPLRLSWGWARVTHVCNLWRAVALASPSLWTTIPVHLPSRWLDELVRRSGEMSLTVAGADGTYFDFEPIARQWAYRVRVIEFDSGRGGQYPVHPFVMQPFPKVTEMTLNGDIIIRGSSTFTMTSHIPSLTIFRAEIRSSFSLPSFDFTGNLTELRLIYEPHRVLSEDLFTPPKFIDFMNRMPRMESLYLANCLPVLTTLECSTFASDFACVELPHLRTLTLVEENNMKATPLFIDNIRLPASVTVEISCLMIVRDSADAHALGPDAEPIQLGLNSLFSLGHSESQVHTLAVVQEDMPWLGIDLHGWRDVTCRTDGSPNFRQSDALIPYLLDGTMSQRSNNIGDVAIQYQYDYDIPRVYPLPQTWKLFNNAKDVFANVRVLSFLLAAKPCPAVDSLHGGLPALLCAVQHVEHLRLAAYSPDPRHSTAATLLPALCELHESGTTGNLPRWKVVPALRTLTIQNMGPYTETDAGVTVLDALRRVIDARVGGGSGLHTVYIHNWMLHDDNTGWRKGLADVELDVVYDTTMHYTEIYVALEVPC